MLVHFRILCLFVAVLSPGIKAIETPADTNAENCVGCHQNAVQAWQQSDHAKSMSIASNTTVLGNFNNVTAHHYAQQARFYKENEAFYIELKHENKTIPYKIKYTFGHYPLQQYLTETTHGKYQVLPFSWDSRTASEGGQQWFVINQEDIQSNDRLHWQQPLQNWNGMCADCHSDGLKRNFNTQKNTFNTRFDNINVGCQSCHGKMTEHTLPKNNNKQARNKRTQPKIISQWLIKAGQKTANWQGKKRDNSFMDTCFACHSFRSPLTDGINPEHAFLDQFSPSFITPPLYYPDGQIKEEVFVYGSFLQSKMYKAGVNCVDCHDKHTMKVKAKGNALCLQCHSAQAFNQTEHTKHEKSSEGSMCVNCHMPTTRYMGVDDRRDHSFKVPRPHLSSKLNTSNACIQCHQNKDNYWAANTLKQWHGTPKTLSKTYHNFLKLQNGEQLTFTEHVAIINDKKLNEIIRATAVSHLINFAQNNEQITNQMIKPWVESPLPLIRLAIALTGQIVPQNIRHLAFSALLLDTFRSVRVAAANHLIGNPRVDVELMRKAFDELMFSHNINAWRAEGRLNASNVHFRTNQNAKALVELKQAIKFEPYFGAAYINLADAYKNNGDTIKEANVYKKALEALPADALLQYSYGLHLIRSKKHEDALKAFNRAVQISPTNAQFVYVYALVLDSLGNTTTALSELKRLVTAVDNKKQLVQLGVSFSQKLKDKKHYDYFVDLYKHLN